MTRRRVFPHGLNCPPETWEAIKARAAAHMMNVSQFLVACALHDEAGAGHPLVLSEDDQWDLVRAVDRVENALRDLLRPLPYGSVTLHEAVAILYLVGVVNERGGWDAAEFFSHPASDPDAVADDGYDPLGMAPGDDGGGY